MPRRSRRIASSHSRGSSRRERRPNVYAGPVPDGPADDDATETPPAPADAPVAGTEATRPSPRRPARARRTGPVRSRAAVFTQDLPRELRKLGVVVAGTVVILGVLTVFLR
ncbi:MAG: hypothetical protein V3S18_02865 [Dehalococcoidia bacterium]|jgi:hypothetical protein